MYSVKIAYSFNSIVNKYCGLGFKQFPMEITDNNGSYIRVFNLAQHSLFESRRTVTSLK